MSDLRALFDRLAGVVAPLRDASHLSVLGADRLARAEEDVEVFEPLGEHPDLPPYVPAGVESATPPADSAGGHPDLAAMAAVIDRHQVSLRPVPHHRNEPFWVCDCGRMFGLHLKHSEHVADLAWDAVTQT